MILFCLPYAGGSKSIYYKWKNYLDPSIKLYPVELKGRGKRLDEGFYENMNEAVEDIYNIIKDEIESDEYAIYGHSMGSLIAYEMYYRIDKAKKRKPKHMFFSGYKAPNIIVKRDISYTLPDDVFIEKIIKLGGTPEEVLNNEELLELVLPILKNDIKMLEKYIYKEREDKISCDISILNGDKDSFKLNEILDWKKHAFSKCKFYTLSGNHFFINDNIENIANIINYTFLEN